jgi:hypothetical protein
MSWHSWISTRLNSAVPKAIRSIARIRCAKGPSDKPTPDPFFFAAHSSHRYKMRDLRRRNAAKALSPARAINPATDYN